MRVCYFGTYDYDYSRNRILIEGLTRNGVDVVECHEPLWQGTADKIATARRAWRLGPARRAASAYSALLRRAPELEGCEALILGYMGQLDAFPARFLANRLQIPLVLDVFMSISLIVRERQLAAPGSAVDRVVSLVEHGACKLADKIWLDTELYVDYFRDRYGLPRDKFRLIPTGADDRYFYPVPDPRPTGGRAFNVMYIGKYVPLHGVSTIVRAAAALRDEGVRFEMIGMGDARAGTMALARSLGADNIVFDDWVEKDELAERMAESDVSLGVFGERRQGLITIPNKVYQGLAVRKPVVTGRTPAADAAFESGRHLLLVPLEDPAALADAIRQLRDDAELRQRLAEEGYRAYQASYTPTALGRLARNYLEETLGERVARGVGTDAA